MWLERRLLSIIAGCWILIILPLSSWGSYASSTIVSSFSGHGLLLLLALGSDCCCYKPLLAAVLTIRVCCYLFWLNLHNFLYPNQLLFPFFSCHAIFISVIRVKGYTRFVQMYVTETKTQHMFVGPFCHAHSNAHKPHKTATPTFLKMVEYFFHNFNNCVSQKNDKIGFAFTLAE